MSLWCKFDVEMIELVMWQVQCNKRRYLCNFLSPLDNLPIPQKLSPLLLLLLL